LPPQKICKIILIPTAFVVLAILSFLTWQQCGYWKNSIVLYEHALQITKNNDLAHYNLGDALKDQGNMEEALKHFLEAVKINPNSADAHNNIGIILELHFKKYDEAIYHYHRALRIDSNNPGTHFNLGIALAAKGERQEAIKHFQQAIYLKPDYEAARKWLRLTMETEQKQTKR
jgi:tetratricopeptide (TPR) repeat protein